MTTGTNIGSLFWTTGINTTGLRRDSKKAQGALSGLFKPSIIGAAALAAAMIKVGDAALSFSRDFETAFAEVQTISQTARDNADAMRETLLRMTTEIPVGAVDATKALYQIVSAGFDGADAMNVLEISAKAAIAGVTSTAVAADTLTTIINAYALSADDATKISDALFKTVELGKTTLSEIGASFSQVASIAAAYGVEVNDVLASLAAITKQGASTSEAITNIKGAIVALAKEFGPAVFQGRSLGEAFQFARDEADKSGKTYEEFFGRVQASTGILQLTGKNAIIFSESLDKINNSAGSTEAALGVMNGTLAFQEDLFKNNLNVLLGQFGDGLNRIKKDILPGLNQALKVAADESIPGYAKALSVLMNSFNFGLLFGGKQFSAEQFSPEIVQFQKEAERQVKAFKERTANFSDEQFQKEVARVEKLKDENKEALRDIQDRKEKGYQFDEKQLKNARQSALTYYKVLEDAETKLAKIREGTAPPGGGGVPETVKKRTFGDIEADIIKARDAISKSTKSQIQDANDRLKLLEKEKQDWLDIANAVEVATETVKGFEKIKGGEVTSYVKPIAGSVTFQDLKGANLEMKKLIAKIKAGEYAAAKMQDELDFEKKIKLAETFQEASAALNDLANLAGKFDEKLGEAVSSAAELATGLSNVIVGLAMGDIFQVIGGIAQAISSLVTTKEINDTEQYTKAVKTLESAYEDLNFQIDKALGRDRVTSRIEAIKNIEAQIDALEKLIKAEEESVDVTKILGIKIKERSNTDYEAIDGYKDKIADLNREIQNILIDTTELITGTSGSALSNALVEAFQVGEDAASEFGDVVNDILKNAVQSALARKFLEKPLQDALDQLEKDFDVDKRGVLNLTEEEADRFRDQVTSIGETYARALESAGTALGLDFGAGGLDTDDTGISGAIRRELTEETGGLMLGQFTAMRVDLKTLNEINLNQIEILQESGGYLNLIEINTRNNELIPAVLDELKTMNTNLKNSIA